MGSFPKCFGDSYASKQPSTTISQFCQRFSLAQLQKLTENFDESRVIGRGAFGKVYRARFSINGQSKDIAIKRANPNSTHQGRIAEFENEIFLLCQLHHPNLISLIGFCNDKKEMIVVYEYMPNSSLKDQLFNSISSKLSWKKRLEISIGAARGLHYLHTGAKRTILHRDFKLSDILLDDNLAPKITDFGLSLKGPKFSSKPKPIEAKLAGTLIYLAPEYMIQGRLSDKSDVYSFGAVLLELVCGKSPFKVAKEMERDLCFKNLGKKVKYMVGRGNTEKIIDPILVGKIARECWKLYIDIVERCLNEDENERPAMGEVEVELERALELQELADANNELIDPKPKYDLSNTTPQLQD